MREGIPILASDILPHQQLLGKERGVLFSQGDVHSCVQQLDWALNHPTELANMAAIAQKYVQRNYSWEQITTDNLDVYQRSHRADPARALGTALNRVAVK